MNQNSSWHTTCPSVHCSSSESEYRSIPSPENTIRFPPRRSLCTNETSRLITPSSIPQPIKAGHRQYYEKRRPEFFRPNDLSPRRSPELIFCRRNGSAPFQSTEIESIAKRKKCNNIDRRQRNIYDDCYL